MKKSVYGAVLKDLGPIILRNVFSLVAIIIGGLSILLILLGDTRDGLFLAVVIVINIVIGIIQELRARLSLEKLQATTAQIYTVSRASKNLKLYTEDIQIDDQVSLALGDQVPVDGVIQASAGCECNEALLSGESDNIAKKIGDKILAGSIVVAGTVTITAQKNADESYLAGMTQNLKKYKRSLSPIQMSLLRFIQIMACLLAVIAAVILLRTYLNGESFVSGIVQIAAIASTIIAEGLILASTAFFVYGAVRLARKKVLLQQINAIETIGRMAIVCVDKTGTLTENQPEFETLVSYQDSPAAINELRKLLATYVAAESATTATIQALKTATAKAKPYAFGEVLPFSSARKYAAARLKSSKGSKILVIGASDFFVPLLSKDQKKWVSTHAQEFADSAGRVLFVGIATDGELDKLKSLKNLEVAGLIVLSNALKSGTKDTIHFLQKRGVQVIVISGDNPHTVRAVADLAGINNSKHTLSGTQVETMTDQELAAVILKHPLFARILPSQKQRIIEACQANGTLVGMIGDGANDALAIKQANVGIAMFSGAPATRQIADVVLLNDSFAAVPHGIELSDTIITTLEMIACLFFSRVWAGLLLLFGTIVFNVDYPFSPRNITLLNLFIVGFPIILWTLWPRHRARSLHEPSFLTRTLPFSIANAILIALVTLVTYLSAKYGIGLANSQTNMVTYLVFLIMSVFTISLIPLAIGTIKDRKQQLVIWAGFAVMAVVVLIICTYPVAAQFFVLQPMGLKPTLAVVLIGCGGAVLQQIATGLHIGDRLWRKIQATKAKNKKIPTPV